MPPAVAHLPHPLAEPLADAVLDHGPEGQPRPALHRRSPSSCRALALLPQGAFETAGRSGPPSGAAEALTSAPTAGPHLLQEPIGSLRISAPTDPSTRPCLAPSRAWQRLARGPDLPVPVRRGLDAPLDRAGPHGHDHDHRLGRLPEAFDHRSSPRATALLARLTPVALPLALMDCARAPSWLASCATRRMRATLL